MKNKTIHDVKPLAPELPDAETPRRVPVLLCPGVSFSVYQELMQASSMGFYYNRYIRGRYK